MGVLIPPQRRGGGVWENLATTYLGTSEAKDFNFVAYKGLGTNKNYAENTLMIRGQLRDLHLNF